jgi:hypothetical protein
MEYEVRWTREQWFKVAVEADSPEQAELKFWHGEFGKPEMYGTEIQEGIDILEIGEEQ